ncbi:TPA: hypothetical protein ACKE0A_001624 [Enterococcus faecium]
MLEMIRTIDDPSVAYAFVDEGCYGEKGLDSVRSGMKKEAILFYLDSVGADTPLQFSGNYFSNKEQWLKQVDKLKEKNVNVNFKFKLATHGDPVARYHQPSNFSNRVGP